MGPLVSMTLLSNLIESSVLGSTQMTLGSPSEVGVEGQR